MIYQSLTDAAARWGVSRQRAQQWVAAGRVPDACRIARIWLVPINAPRPERREPIRKRRANHIGRHINTH